MLYRIVRTGMDMFDVCRAYGLALVLSVVSDIEEIYERVIVEDYGSYYQVEGPRVAGENLSGETRWLALFTPSDGWSRIFLTVSRSPTLNVKNEKQKKKLESTVREIIGKYSKALEANLGSILERYSGFHTPEITNKNKKDFETLYQSLEVSASKGFRRAVRDGYGEGGQVYAPIEDLALAYLGGAHFVYWVWGENLIGILPAPQRVLLENHLEIGNLLKSGFVNRSSVISAISHYAVLFAMKIREKKANQAEYSDKYSSLIFNAMTKTGNQWKPVSGGIFPLELLFSLIEDDLHVSKEIFDIWNNVFRVGSMKGNEDLALTLAEFIAHPNLDLFEEHVRVHLRYLINKGVKVETYSENCIKEVMKFVS
ncbi:MAG: hypothetical protein ACTSUQ_01530 [Candidatus Freyarchaeota archaeon]